MNNYFNWFLFASVSGSVVGVSDNYGIGFKRGYNYGSDYGVGYKEGSGFGYGSYGESYSRGYGTGLEIKD